MFFYDYYWLALIPLVIAMLASWNVKSTYSKYQKIRNGRGLTGAMAARQILDANGLTTASYTHLTLPTNSRV